MQSLTIGDLFDHIGEQVVDPKDGATGVIRLPDMVRIEVAWNGPGKNPEPDELFPPSRDQWIAVTGWSVPVRLLTEETDVCSEPTGLYLLEPMLKRAARQCIRDHEPRDYLAHKAKELADPDMQSEFYSDMSRSSFVAMVIADYADRRRMDREYPDTAPAPTRSVHDVVLDAEVLGNAATMSKYGATDAIVVRMTYARGKKWLADYEVNVDPTLSTSCWQD